MTAKNTSKPSAAVQTAADGFLAQYGVKADPKLIDRALTHRSWAFEHGGAPHNERLEFLGDSVLGFAVTTRLYKKFSKLSEGELAKRRAAVVSTITLATTAREIGLGQYLKLGNGELATGGRDKDSILADTLEAVIGAVYLSTDIQVATKFVLQLLESKIAEVETLSRSLDPKTTLQEIAAAHGLPHPHYVVTGTGPDHNREYTAHVALLGVQATGVGSSKKAAELAAAREVVAELSSGTIA